MANTLVINVVDRSVAPLNHVNIAVINQPNPVEGYMATADEVAKLIQIPNYFITDENGVQVSGLNYYKYFPKSGGGGGGGSAVLIDKTITENGEYAASADNADGYSAVVVDVPSGGGSVNNMVTLYDYDGTVIASYTPQQFAQLESYPTPPSHEYLTFDEYNWTLSDAKTYVATYGSLNIGATYNTTDGATKLFVTLSDSTLSPNLKLGINGSVDVDWGDGSAHDTMVGTNVDTPVYQSHTYSSAGNYVISFSVTGTAQISAGLIVSSTSIAIDKYQLTLKKIFICGNISIGVTAFQNHSTLSEIAISNDVTSIGTTAFNNCISLTSITIPDNVTSIGNNAFVGCNTLTSITIPDNVTSIGNNAFEHCRTLTSITISDSVTSIGQYAFHNCYALTSITIPDNVTSIENNTFYNCYALTSITISDSVTSIGQYAFQNCYALTSITIPDNVTNIGAGVFEGCYALTSITIPDNVTNIGNGVFYNCNALTSIMIPDNVTSIGKSTFNGCRTLTSITIPDNVTSIGNNAFEGCGTLTSITIPDNVTSIGNNAFYNCYALTSITISDSVTSIGAGASKNCYSLGYIRFESETPPTVSNSSAFANIPTTCKIYVPSASLSQYESATNYPSSSTYTYVGY